MHSVSLCRGLSFLLVLAQSTIADDSLGLGNILIIDNPNPSLSAFSPPDGSLSSDNLGIDPTEPSTTDGGNWEKAQDSFKNGDSLDLASGAGNCIPDAGTRPGRRRLRRNTDICHANYNQFKPSRLNVRHNPGWVLWATSGRPFVRALLLISCMRAMYLYRRGKPNHHEASYKICLT